MNEDQLDTLNGRILLAVDDFVNQKVITAVFEKMGLQIEIANDGAEAVKMATISDYDLIFMDMQMPNMTGYEAAALLKEQGVTTPIVAQTASAMKPDGQDCLDAGCDDYISKPIDLAKLRQVVSRYLNKARS